MKAFATGIFLLAGVFLISFPYKLFALNQVFQPSFTIVGSWTYDNNILFGNLSTLARNVGGFAEAIETMNNARRDGIINQIFTTPDGPTNCWIKTSFRTTSTVSYTSFGLIGTLRDTASGSYPNEDLVSTFLNRTTLEIPYVWMTTVPSGTIPLEANRTYRAQVYIDINLTGGEATDIFAEIDDLYCNISPHGLMASETMTRDAQLSWATSTGAGAVLQYRVFRSVSGLPGSFVGIATLPAGTTTFTDSPPADLCAYAVSDIESGTMDESPLSPVATFARANLQILSVSAVQVSVSKGQNSIPVALTLQNTGAAACVFGGASLTLSLPGHRFNLNSPAPGAVIAAGATFTAAFSVDVLATAPSGVVTIDATASATGQVSGAPTGDTGAGITDSWIVQEPANVQALEVVVPPVVYRGQTGVFVQVELSNNGEANATINSATPAFSLGSYTNLQALTAWPQALPGGGQILATFMVDIGSLSPIGTAGIDVPEVRWVDANSGNLFIDSGANLPGTWIIQRALTELDRPSGIARDSAGSVHVTDAFKHHVQKFTPAGTYLTRWGTQGSGDGQFNGPNGIAIDGSNNVYIVDTGNHRIQKFNSAGGFLTKWGTAGSGDGQFNQPWGITLASSGWVYIADTGNNRIQVFDANGVFQRKWGMAGAGDGQFNTPRGITVIPSGFVFVVDSNNARVQKFDATGTFISKWGASGAGDGQFNTPMGIQVDAAGDVLVVDQQNQRIQRFRFP